MPVYSNYALAARVRADRIVIPTPPDSLLLINPQVGAARLVDMIHRPDDGLLHQVAEVPHELVLDLGDELLQSGREGVVAHGWHEHEDLRIGRWCFVELFHDGRHLVRCI